MKPVFDSRMIVAAGLVLGSLDAFADPQIDSWFTAFSGKYARIYTSDAAKSNGIAVTTWSNGTLTQALPAYAGVQEIDSSTNWIYIRTSGLGIHNMGPWYLDAARAQTFPNLPVNTHALYRIPRQPTVSATKTINGGGSIGCFVDGVAMFNSWDAFYWNGSADVAGGAGGASGYWNRDAYVNEGVTFDAAYAHQPQDGTYHYHADPIALRYLLGDHVDYDPATKTFSESTNAVTRHSPILGWVSDGYPVYGPYGYANPTNDSSGVRRMVSGYILRNGQLGTSNLAAYGRTTIPQWAVRIFNVSSNQAGPGVSTNYPLGRYMEDNDYLGDLGYMQGIDFDLDEHNGRYCVTPEYPNGIYAYFVAIDSNGVPVFPYNIGRAFYGIPTGGNPGSISESVTTNFLGGTNSTIQLSAPNLASDTVTLVWSAVEGGIYEVQSSTNLSGWTVLATNVPSNQTTAACTNSTVLDRNFYRVTRTSVASFDPVALAASVAPGGSAARGSVVTVIITLPTTPPLPPANNIPVSVVLAGNINASSLSRPSSGTVLATFSIPSTNSATGPQNIVVTFSPAPTYTLTNGFTIN